MKRGIIISALFPLLLSGLLMGNEPEKENCDSFLFQPAYCLDHVLRRPAQPYALQPGDIMLATDNNRFWKITHDLALAFEPHNSAMVFARPDGTLAILEAGPNDTLFVRCLPAYPHLREYECKGPVWIRKRRCPLTPEQSACLTAFALRQEGKKFSLVRLGAQLTPLRSRGPLRTYVLGKPQGDRDGYFCSELVTEAGVAAGVIDPGLARPAATYPHDLFFDRSLNLYLSRNFTLEAGWFPPARWTADPEKTRGDW